MAKKSKVRVQDDLFNYVNGDWIKKAVIPEDKPRAGGFSDLSLAVEKTLMRDMRSMAAKSKPIPDKYMGEAVALYKKARNLKRRNADGIKPVMKDLAFIKGLTDIKAFNRKIKELVLGGYPLPFRIGVGIDMKDASKHCLVLEGPSLILPDTTYYEPAQKKEHDALLGVYRDMVSKLLARTDLTKDEQSKYLEDALAFDEKLSKLVKSSLEWSDYVKNYNPIKTSIVCHRMRPVKLKRLLEKLYGEEMPEEIIVYEPRYLKGFHEMFTEETYPLYQHWAYIKTLVSATKYLSEDLREIGSAYRNAVTGTPANPSIEKSAYLLASDEFSEPMGLYYGRTYFGEEAKKDITSMVHEIIDAYIRRMRANDFLKPETKEKAIVKLQKIGIKMGYPDEVDEMYDVLHVRPRSSLYEAVSELDAAQIAYGIGLLSKPVDKKRWIMAGHTVNACYNPQANDITFPAAILQAPFYSLKQSRSENLGGIGCVIGHEICHAFDNNGAQCDENGNINNWWTKDDYREFKRRTKAMIREFDGIPYHGGKVNGELVVSENIADNGGMAATLDVMDHMKDKDYQAYFLNWGRIWCMKAREEYVKLLLRIDVHSPQELRANIQPRNFQQWYDAFDVKETDKMYLPPKDRVHIW
jgi:putative endopeptidase